jgi:NAD(P)-dependent dehydrogenase (short-subunit alcohol dehydrogenase family)
LTYGELHGRVALVTGGTSGIGRACVERLREEEMVVLFTGRNEERGRAVAADTGGIFIAADARDRATCAEAVDEALRVGGRIDVLVANAGVIYGGAIEATPEPAFRELLEVNLTSAFRYSRACFAAMKARGSGSIVHIASSVAVRGAHELSAYSVTKAGVVALSELFAAEGARHGVRSNAVCPGDVVPGVQATPAGHEEHAEDPSSWAHPPSGRFGTGADVAALVAWLASDESEHMTGATLRIDGGAGAALRTTAQA